MDKNHHASKRLRCNARTHLSTPSSHRFPRRMWRTGEAYVEPSPCSADASRSRAWARLYKGSPARLDRFSPRFETPALQCSHPLVHTSSHRFPRVVWKTTGGVDKNNHARKCLHRNARTHLSTSSSHHSTHCVENPGGPLIAAHLGGRAARQCPPRWASTRAQMTRPANGGPCRPRPARRRALQRGAAKLVGVLQVDGAADAVEP